MAITENSKAAEAPKPGSIDFKLEIVVVPVSDVDRAKAFYAKLGWRLDADFASDDGWRVIQVTPPGSNASVIFGRNVTAAAPGSAQGLYLIVSDVQTARDELVARGIEVGEVFHGSGDTHTGPDEPYISGSRRVSGGSCARQLSLLRLIPRSRRQWLAASGDHDAPARPCRGRHDIQIDRRSRRRAAPRGGRAWRAREAHRRQVR